METLWSHPENRKCLRFSRSWVPVMKFLSKVTRNMIPRGRLSGLNEQLLVFWGSWKSPQLGCTKVFFELLWERYATYGTLKWSFDEEHFEKRTFRRRRRTTYWFYKSCKISTGKTSRARSVCTKEMMDKAWNISANSARNNQHLHIMPHFLHSAQFSKTSSLMSSRFWC